MRGDPMADKKTKPEIQLKDYAGGWITEKKGTEVPGFLKLAFPIIGLSGVAYLVLYINGDVNQSERGPFVQALDKVTGDANGLMYAVTALALVFVITVVVFAIRKTDH
jgi:Na+/H+ antiporter NhaC